MRKKDPKVLVVFALLLFALLAVGARPAQATTFTVINTNNGGPGSLRQAITDANTSPNTDTINFNIPGSGIKTIRPFSPLPVVTGPVTIDGYSQPGASPNTNGPDQGTNAVLRVELDGSSAGFTASGLHLDGGASTVKGLAINRFAQYGIMLEGPNGYTIEGNFIGTDVAGTADLGNGFAGVDIITSHTSIGNTIGGTTPAARNVISGNRGGGVVVGTNVPNLIQGNLIGTDGNGAADLGNDFAGVSVNRGTGSLVGGSSPAARNVISGNNGYGVRFHRPTHGQTLQGNYARGNFIGADVTGADPLGNSGNGVHLEGLCSAVKNHVVGGSATGEGNTIAHNGGAGVAITAKPCSVAGVGSSASGNSVLLNSIHSNGGPGIDLGGDGLTPNDPGDGDTGPNNLQNSPVLTQALGDVISGTLNSVPNLTFKIQFFSSPSADLSGNDEGKTYLGQTTATTDGSGNATFGIVTESSTVGDVVTATATSPSGDTSEFSTAITVAAAIPNDPFAGEQAIGGATASVDGTNVYTTREPGEPDHAPDVAASAGENSVWYRWEAPASGQATVDTCTEDFDTVLAVYTGETLGSLAQVASNDDTPGCGEFGNGSKVTFEAQAGTTYRISVAGYHASSDGTFTLKVAGASPPNTTITSGPSGATTSRSAVFEFVSSKPGSTFRCSLDGAAFAPCSSPKGYANLSNGPHTFKVRATDASGNVDASPAARTWKVDAVRPTVEKVSPLPGAANVSPATNITVVFSEPMKRTTINKSTFILRKKGTTTKVAATVKCANAACTAAILNPTAALSPGTTYTAAVTRGARDLAGNRLAASKVWKFKVRR